MYTNAWQIGTASIGCQNGNATVSNAVINIESNSTIGTNVTTIYLVSSACPTDSFAAWDANKINYTISAYCCLPTFIGGTHHFDLSTTIDANYFIGTGANSGMKFVYEQKYSSGAYYELQEMFTCSKSGAVVAPETATFTLTNVYDGYDAVKLHITSQTTNTTSWEFYRSNTSGGTYSLIGTQGVSDLDFYDDNVITGQTYWYKVKSFNACVSRWSSALSKTVQSVVDNSCVIRTKAVITNPISGDTTSHYELWRSATENGTYQRVGASINGNTIVYDKIDTYGADYWYQIRQVTPYWTLTGNTKTQYTDVLTMPDSPILTGVTNTGTTTINLSWSDSNTWKQEYEVWRKPSGGSYSLLSTVTGTTYIDHPPLNVLFDYKIRGKISCFAPTYIYSPYSNEVAYALSPVITPPVIVGASNITCTGATITWTNTNISGVTGNKIKEFDGVNYNTIATLSSGSTTYSFTGLQPISSHQYSVWAYNIGREVKSAGITVTTQDPTPFNLSLNQSYQSAAFSWDINDHPYGTAIRPDLRLQGESQWNGEPNIAHNATSYTYTGLSWNTNYEARIVRIGSEYPSIIYGFTTPAFIAPSNLIITSLGDHQICLQWQNNSINDYIEVWYKNLDDQNVWILYSTVSNVTTTECVSGLNMYTNYEFVVINHYNAYQLASNHVQGLTTVSFIPSFCENKSYIVTNTTCGNSTGKIEIPSDATIFYDFTLTDIQGNSYNLSLHYWTGLTGSWYKITASVKPKWYFHYGADDCVLDWIPLYDTNTTITLDDTKIKNAICGGFGGGKGRIVYLFSDSSSATTWTFTLYNVRYDLVNTQNLTDISQVVYFCKSDIYYGILENEFGCTYLINLTQVPADKLWTVQGIQRLFLTTWTSSIGYNYYDSTSDDWYVAGLDTQQFTSTKIAEYLNLPDFWYEIRLDTATMSYAQSLNRGSNGLTYNETINISIPSADNQKWKQLVNILTQRYIVVFQDNNGNWWTSFYRNGAEVKSYRLSENQYTISFIHPSIQHMLTAIDYNYVKLNIL